eukprot:scaffold305_cov267-Chaetoceros_neogracile.AAC.4
MSDWRRSSDGDSGPVVPPYTKIPSGQKRGGNPAIFIEDLDDDAKVHIQGHAEKTALKAAGKFLKCLPINI